MTVVETLRKVRESIEKFGWTRGPHDTETGAYCLGNHIALVTQGVDEWAVISDGGDAHAVALALGFEAGEDYDLADEVANWNDMQPMTLGKKRCLQRIDEALDRLEGDNSETVTEVKEAVPA